MISYQACTLFLVSLADVNYWLALLYVCVTVTDFSRYRWDFIWVQLFGDINIVTRHALQL